ncbi:acyl-CoA thioesterase [Rhodococcus qingshengii]|uniref:acyl-CoA thioesterase n=1 Tax=Rhodococcus qingshengii TaxID=334542 RepID=UPI00136CA0A4|nr:acyl-CoA thioesterase domain-containing protein [Rhodococcus qingshengii]MYV26124.1 acyl-CoA thioesterase II [Rhodococcus erythropolis]UXF65964.1 thioesterase family protein [Rhodococcus qingshengii]
MSAPTSGLADVFDLESTGPDRWQGSNDGVRLPQLFGGQLVAQSILAAGHTVTDGKAISSVHTHFLRPGSTEHATEFSVDRLRDGKRLSTRGVDVHQDGRLVCRSTVSASSIDEGITHSRAVPTALPPTECVTLQELAEADGGLGEVWEEFSAIEIRVSPIDSQAPTTHSAAPPRNIWMRSAQRLSDDPLIHVAALAYASDLMLMATALTPHGYDIGQEHSLDTDWTGVSLDHTMWFQRPVRADEWLLFEHSTPTAHTGRAVVNAAVFDQSGLQICQITQEALLIARTE